MFLSVVTIVAYILGIIHRCRVKDIFFVPGTNIIYTLLFLSGGCSMASEGTWTEFASKRDQKWVSSIIVPPPASSYSGLCLTIF